MRFGIEIAQGKQEIAQHAEREADHDVERVGALPAQAHAVQSEQDEQ